MQLRSAQQQTTQYTRNIDNGLAWLNTADSALTQANSSVQRVRQLVVQGANAANGPDERGAMADEVDQLRQTLIQLGNTQYGNTPVFAGTAKGSVAFDPATGVFVGNTAAVNRQVSSDPQSGTLAVNVPGPQAFTDLLSGGVNGSTTPPTVAPGLLERISTALRSGDTTGLNTALGQLDTAAQAMSSAQSAVGARVNRLNSVQTLANSHLDTITTGLSNAEDVDLPGTIIKLQIQQNAYQAALGATAKIIQPSLMDFLR
jgi:flagellar hook-associated protein 3 FlgL